MTKVEPNPKEMELAKTLLADINTLAGAGQCYPSTEAHDAAMIAFVADALAEYRERLLVPIHGCAEYYAVGVSDQLTGFLDILDLVTTKRTGDDTTPDPTVE